MTILVTAREIHIIPHSAFNPMQIFSGSFDPAASALGIKSWKSGENSLSCVFASRHFAERALFKDGIGSTYFEARTGKLKMGFSSRKNFKRKKTRSLPRFYYIENYSFTKWIHFQVNNCYRPHRLSVAIKFYKTTANIFSRYKYSDKIAI